MHSLDRKLARDLWRHRGQAAAIGVVVACAVATALMSFSVLRSLAATRAAFYEQYRFAHVFSSLTRAPESIASELRRIPGVAALQTRIVADVALELDGMEEPAGARVLSLPEAGKPADNALFLRQGRTVGTGAADEAVLSEGFARAHGLVPGDRLLAMLGGARRQLVIVGIALSPEYIYALGPEQIAPDDRRFGVLWMGRQALEAALGLSGEFNEVSARIDATASEPQVLERFNAILARYGGSGAYGREQQSSHAFLSAMFEQLAGVGRIVPPIFLAVAVFLACSALVRLINTERRNIGLLKSLGLSDRTLAWHYLKFILVPVIIGIVLGLIGGTALGYGLTQIYTRFFHFPELRYTPDAAIAASASGAAALSTISAALAAVRRALFLPPAVAMAPATPSAYRRIPGERLAIWRRCSQPLRMIIRHLARWPLRALLTVLGVAMAVALQVSMLFSFDALDHIIDVFYARSQRQDLSVFFAAAQPRTVADEMARWPGVIQVEEYRRIAARLSFGTRSRIVTLTGRRSTASLNRLLDLKLEPASVPAHGIALSTKLAEVLHARVGDLITVQPEGGKPFKVAVALLTQQYIGMDSTMELQALNALSGEGERISAVQLLLDQRRSGEFYRTLKNAPMIAGVSMRSAVIESFRQTMATTLSIIVSFFVGFAGLTAFGIVYSCACIILSEREQELAILMALGFNATEAGTILVGELALLMLLALPLGCALGRGLAWLIAQRLDTELYRVPLVIDPGTYGVAMLVVLLAAIASTWIVARQVSRLDLLALLNATQ